MAKAGREVAAATAGVLAERPSYIPAPTGLARGSEEMTFNDIVIPRLSIIQDLSPQRKKNDPLYIPNAEEGMFFNTVTKDLFDGQAGVFIIPVYFKLEWVLWKKRTEGSGFLGAFQSKDEGVRALSAQQNPAACELVDTAQHFCLQLDKTGQEVASEVVISMAKSQMKASRSLNSLVKIAGGDRFSRVYKLSVIQVSGSKGEYYNWKIEQLGYPAEPVFRRAESMYNAVVKGGRSIDRSEEHVSDDESL